MRTPLLFIDGVLRASSEKEIHNFSPGTLKAQGVFETMKVYRGEIFALKELQEFL